MLKLDPIGHRITFCRLFFLGNWIFIFQFGHILTTISLLSRVRWLCGPPTYCYTIWVLISCVHRKEELSCRRGEEISGSGVGRVRRGGLVGWRAGRQTAQLSAAANPIQEDGCTPGLD